MSKLSIQSNDGTALTTVRRLPPEDIRVGDDVALYEITYQVPSFLWCGADPVTLPTDRPVQLTYMACDNPTPLKVKGVCLPFVLCEAIDEVHHVYDVRQVQLVRLDERFASLVRRVTRTKSRKSKRKRKQK